MLNLPLRRLYTALTPFRMKVEFRQLSRPVTFPLWYLSMERSLGLWDGIKAPRVT